MTTDNVPFRFEDLNGEPEPESWGPTYDIKRKRGQSVSDAVREAQARVWKRDKVFHTNSASGQAFEFSASKHRARMKAEFTAQCNADRRAWAEGRLTIDRPGFSGNIVAAYAQAMADKRARLATRKPHYVLRAGEWRLKEAA
jgi:hypothetical protein